MQLAKSVIALMAGYGLGAFPSADLVARLAAPGADLRKSGSHNPGALNAGKQLGKTIGGAVLALDVGKGAAAAALGRFLGGPTLANVAASAAVIGHCHPPGRREGGKGVATSVGQVIGTFPRYLPLDVGVAVATAAMPRWTQRTWAATAVASFTWVTSATVAWHRKWSTGIDTPAPGAMPLAAAVSSAVIAHRFVRAPLIDGRPTAP